MWLKYNFVFLDILQRLISLICDWYWRLSIVAYFTLLSQLSCRTGSWKGNAVDLLGSNLTSDIGYPDWDLTWFFWVSPGKCHDITSIRPRPFPIALKLIIHVSPYHPTLYSLILKKSLNNPRRKCWRKRKPTMMPRNSVVLNGTLKQVVRQHRGCCF